MTRIEIHAAPVDGGTAQVVAVAETEDLPEVVAHQLDPSATPHAMGMYLIPVAHGNAALIVLPDGVNVSGAVEVENVEDEPA